MDIKYIKIGLFLSPLFFFAIFYFNSINNQIKPVILKDYNITDITYIQNGLESITPSIVGAVETYVNQKQSESENDRYQKLSIYFTSDSPVYKKQIVFNNINSIKITSIKSIESEDSDLNIQVISNITTSDNKIKTQKFWMKLVKIYDGSLIPHDIGVLNK